MNMMLDAFFSLGQNVNKKGGKSEMENELGVVSEKLPELKLEMKNEDLIRLTSSWEKIWNESNVKAKWLKQINDNEKYWLGNHFNRPEADTTRPLMDNAIFEALETYLPRITRRNPEPMVTLKEGEEKNESNEAFAKAVQKKLADLADEIKLRLKLKKTARHWSIYLLGVAKMGWDIDKDIPTVKIVRPAKLILDPDCTVDEDGYTGNRIGEYRKMEAGRLKDTLKNIGGEEGYEKVIDSMTKKDELGTEIQFIEWWTQEYMCWTLGKEVLLKKKNPHWNYDTTKPGESTVDEYGNETPGEDIKVEGMNHFAVPGMPYIMLSVFNLGKQPVDDTSLMGQNLANQDRINKRGKQIDKAADSMNGGVVVSMARSGLTKDQAQGVTRALQNGGTVVIPDGVPDEAIRRMVSPGLPNDVYNDLVDTRRRLSDIFGTSGLSPSGVSGEKTVRGKYQVQGMDTDRIGGGVSEYLEQFADDVYNWMVQLLYVYDDTYSRVTIKPKIIVSVKEGSLLPKDSMTIANQSIELSSAGKMSILDLYKNLDYPNPEELAANVWLEANAPEILYGKDPRVAQVMQMRQASAENAKPEERAPSQSISFKDLPPDGQAQMAKKVGIDLSPEAIAAHEKFKSDKVKEDAKEKAIDKGSKSPVNNQS